MPLDLSRICALCFDVDGTLRDTDDQIIQRLTNLLQPISFLFHQRNPLPFARRAVMKMEDTGTFLHRFPDRVNIDHHLENLGGLFRRAVGGNNKRDFLLIKGIYEMLNLFKPHYQMAIVSARAKQPTQDFLDYFGLTEFFQTIAHSQTCRHTKPFPDPILWAAEQMGFPPTACLMIGDTTVDILAGKAAGAQTVGVLCGFGEKQELLQAGADLILPSTTHLIDLLI